MGTNVANGGKCLVCNSIFSNMMKHLNKQHDANHLKYIEKINNRISALLKTDLYNQEIADIMFEEGLFTDTSYVSKRSVIEDPKRKRRVLSVRRMGKNNPIFNKSGTIEKIKNSVKDKWVRGDYADRINGMLNKIGDLNPNYKPEIHTTEYQSEFNYRDFLKNFEDINKCSRCGDITSPINIHHVDEDRTNFLISNLEPLCVTCHGDFHIRTRKMSYVTIGKKLSFAACHRLPHHEGKCVNWHGHEWQIEIQIRKRIDPRTFMVMDFKDLKTIISDIIIEELDHSTLNDIILIPTAENLLVWCWEQLMFKGKLKGIEKISIWESPDSVSFIDRNGMRSLLREDLIKNYIQKFSSK